MASSSSSSSFSCCKWSYDVFPSFSGEDVRKTFLSHFVKELDRRSIITFKDNEIERSRSLESELIQAIRDSRITVVVFSVHYASSSWCLNELVEIVKCKENLGQLVIPVFYGLDPCHVRKQTGEFGEAFEKTCCNKTGDEIQLWRKSLTHVSNIAGYHSWNWENEAIMIETVANEVFGKLNFTPSKDFEEFVGIKDHMEKISLLLRLESDEVRMVGIWGPSGIGKTTIARALFNQFSGPFQSSIYIDRAFVSKSMEIYRVANADDYNMKLHLQKAFLSELLGQKDIKIGHLGMVEERLKHMKVLVVIDDLDDQVVLDALVGRVQSFGHGSIIIVVTKDKHILRSRGIDHIYEVSLPSDKLALEMFCRFAFKQNYPPNGFTEAASQVVKCAGSLPLGLKVLGSHLRGRDKEDWVNMLPRLQKVLDGKIEKTLRLSYDDLDSNEDKEIFRYVSCMFNGEKIKDIEKLLADSDLDVNIGLKNLVDKSLIQVRSDVVEMHCLLQEMGREIVRAQSCEPGQREFLVDSNDIRNVLRDNSGTKKVLGIALEIDGTEEFHVHKGAFHGMPSLCFLKIYTKTERFYGWHLHRSFNYLPPKLRLLSWDCYPMRYMPPKFHPENLIKLRMRNSKLKMLGKGVRLLTCLKDMDLSGSENLKKITNLSMATNLETLDLSACSSLTELTPSSIKNLNKLMTLDMTGCTKLRTLPDGINLQSLIHLNLHGCSQLKSFPDISKNISQLTLSETGIEKIPSNLHLENLVDLRMHALKSKKLWEGVEPLTPIKSLFSTSLTRLYLSHIPSLVELPSSFQTLNSLRDLKITHCKNLETLPVGINLKSLWRLNLAGCSRLKKFPDISTNISVLGLFRTGIEEVPCWADKFSKLENLFMPNSKNLKNVSLNIYKSKSLATIDDRAPLVKSCFVNCFNLDHEALLQQESIIKYIILPGVQVPSYFTHRTTGNSLTNISILEIQNPFSSPPFFRFRACAVFEESLPPKSCLITIRVSCRFRGRLEEENHFDSTDQSCSFWTYQDGRHMVIFDCFFPLYHENYPHPVKHYDHVDIQFHLTDDCSKFSLVGCGIRLPNDTTPYTRNRASNLEVVEDRYMDNYDTEESGDSDIEAKKASLYTQVRKRLTICLGRIGCA